MTSIWMIAAALAMTAGNAHEAEEQPTTYLVAELRDGSVVVGAVELEAYCDPPRTPPQIRGKKPRDSAAEPTILKAKPVVVRTHRVADVLSDFPQKDRERIRTEIATSGLDMAPRVVDRKSAERLPVDTTAVVMLNGGRETLEALAHLRKLDSIYLILDHVNEEDLALLSKFPKLRRLELGMSGRYRLKGKFWKPVGELTTLETFNVRCHS